MPEVGVTRPGPVTPAGVAAAGTAFGADRTGLEAAGGVLRFLKRTPNQRGPPARRRARSITATAPSMAEPGGGRILERAPDAGSKSNYELFNRSKFNIRYWSWNYRGCWHQTCPPMDPRSRI